MFQIGCNGARLIDWFTRRAPYSCPGTIHTRAKRFPAVSGHLRVPSGSRDGAACATDRWTCHRGSVLVLFQAGGNRHLTTEHETPYANRRGGYYLVGGAPHVQETKPVETTDIRSLNV